MNGRVLAYLLLGRGVFRFAQYAAAIALIGIWGQSRYGHFAAALGAVLWLTAITSVGTEKAALKLLARARRTGPELLNAFLLTACAIPVLPVALFAVALAGDWTEPAALYAGAAALAATLGANTLLVGIMRVRGAPIADAGNFFLLAATYGGLTALAAVGLIGPVAYLGLQLSVVSVLNIALVRRLGGIALTRGIRGRLARLFGRTILVMGGTELCAHAAPSILFIELAMTRWSDQSGWLYLTDLVWAAVLNLFFYVLRVYQPRTSQRGVGAGASAGRERARRLARIATLASAGWLAAIAAVLAVGDRTDLHLVDGLDGVGLVVFLLVMLISRFPVFATVNLSGYLLENADDRCLRASAVASVLGLVGLAAAGMVAIPALGAVGALAVLGVMDLVQAAGLLALTTGATTPAGAETPRRVAADPGIRDKIAIGPPAAAKSVTLRSHNAPSQRPPTSTPTPGPTQTSTMEHS